MSETAVFEKEMGITHRDFVRLLPRAVGRDDFELAGGTISLVDGAKSLEITLSAESERHIASVTLPVTNVRFAFTGYDDAAAEMAHIDFHFQRGGG